MNTRKPIIGRDEQEGFDNFVKYEYEKDIQLAREIAFPQIQFNPRLQVQEEIAYGIVLDKLASPRIYLIDKWRDLTDDERLSYYSEEYRKKAKADSEELSRKASEALSQ